MYHNSKRVNIAYVIDEYLPGAGTENQLITLIDHLDLKRFRPHVVNLRPRRLDRVYPTHCHLVFLGVQGRVWSLEGLMAMLRLARFIRRQRIDIVQAHFLESRIVATIATKLARRAKLVFCKRNMHQQPTRLTRFLTAHSDYCLCNTRAGCDMVVKREGMPRDRTVAIHNGVRLPQRDGAPLSRSSLGIPENVPVVTMIANFREVKRVDRFLNVAARLENRQCHLLVVGQGRREVELRKLADELDVTDRVHFCHTFEGIADILHITDIGALTSHSEGLSNALIEFAMAGIPAVAFDVGGNAEVIIHGLTGYLVREADLDTMAAYLNKLVVNESLRRRLGSHARNVARRRFAVRTMVEKTQEFYRDILSGHQVEHHQ